MDLAAAITKRDIETISLELEVPTYRNLRVLTGYRTTETAHNVLLGWFKARRHKPEEAYKELCDILDSVELEVIRKQAGL